MEDEILEIYNVQKSYYDNFAMRNVKNRINALKKLKQNIQLLLPKIYKAFKTDLNKSEQEVYMTEVGLVLTEINFMIKHARNFSKPTRVPTPITQFHASSYMAPYPYGNVLIISPWNYPFLLSIEPLVDAIAAGNSVILKPSSRSANVSAVIKELVDMTFERGHVDVVLGGVDECTKLLDLDFDYIFYTGSTRVGEIVMKKAAEHFTPVTLEMGGKSPCIVDETANIPLAAKRIVFGKFLNCGQTCVAPDYVYCHASVKDRLVKEIERQIVLQFGVDPIHNDNYPKIINEKQFNQAVKLIDKDSLVFGGKIDADSLKIEPTILESKFDDEVMKNEIFAPILPVLTFDSLDEAIKKVKSLYSPLALYIFSSKKENQNKVINSIQFGGGCINDTIIHIASNYLPFGGVKQSGLGAYHGKTGFDTFSHYKSIVNKKTWFDMPMRYQPYNKFKMAIIKLFLK